MATTSDIQQHNGLNAIIQRWDRRLRVQQTLAWFARALIPGLALGVAVGVISRLRPWLTNTEVLWVAVVVVWLGIGVLMAFVWGRARASVDAARRFDVTFGLKERVSTALELIDGRIQADPALTDLQVRDALIQAEDVDARAGLPLALRREEWGVALALALMLAVLVVVPNATADNVAVDPERDAIVEQVIAQVEDTIATVATDPTLDDATREEILDALEVDMRELQNEAITADEALATARDVEEIVRDQANQMELDRDGAFDAVRSAVETLQEQPDNQSGGGEQQQPNEAQQPSGLTQTDPNEALSQELEQMSEQLENSDQGQQGQQNQQAPSPDAARQAADALRETNPDLAQAMDDYADAMEQGDTQAAQEALEQAQEALQQQQRQQEQAQQSAQELQQQADELQQTQEEFSQQQQQQSDQGQQQQSDQQGQQQGQAQEGQDGDQQPGEQGEQGEAQAQQAEGGNQQPQEGDQPSAQQSEGQGSTAAQDAGDQAGTQAEDTTGDVPTDSQERDQDVSEGEQDSFQEVFAPRRAGGEGAEEDIVLEPGEGNAPLRDGDFSDNPEGDTTVPYDQVFSDYANSANEALDQGVIPLALRDVVREYFTSLAPRSGE
jgi:hypothetical protein